MWMKSVDEDCREEKAVSLNATECYVHFIYSQIFAQVYPTIESNFYQTNDPYFEILNIIRSRL